MLIVAVASCTRLYVTEYWIHVLLFVVSGFGNFRLLETEQRIDLINWKLQFGFSFIKIIHGYCFSTRYLKYSQNYTRLRRPPPLLQFFFLRVPPPPYSFYSYFKRLLNIYLTTAIQYEIIFVGDTWKWFAEIPHTRPPYN